MWLARGPLGKTVPLGVYDHPAPDDLAPNIHSVHLPEGLPGTMGNDVVRALVNVTKARDKVESLISSVLP